MSATDLAMVIIGGLIVTYATRLSFLVLLPAERLPAAIQRALQYAPPAVLAAIILPTVAGDGGPAAAPRWLAASAAALVAWRTGNTWLTILVGMLLLWIGTAWVS